MPLADDTALRLVLVATEIVSTGDFDRVAKEAR